MKILNTVEPISVTTLELGVVTSSILQLNAKGGEINYGAGLWPFETSVNAVEASTIYDQYKSYVDEIMNTVRQSTIRTIISVGIDADFNDMLAENCDDKYEIVMIPNSQYVDGKRIKRNYSKGNIHIVTPHQAWEGHMGINTIIVVPIFKLADDSIYMYSYPRRFMGSDVNRYSFRCISLELLPAIQDLDYRTSPASPELCELSQIEGKYFNQVLTFKLQ